MATVVDLPEVRYVPVPTCITPFVIVAATRRGDGRKGFVARWARRSARVDEVRDACDWRGTREEVRKTMAYLYADVQEVKG